MLTRFSHVMMYVYDLDRAVKWYTEILGFRIQFVAPKHYASLFHERMKCRLDLHPTSAGNPNVGHGPIAYFSTDDIDRDVAELRGKGVTVEDPRTEGSSPRFCGFKDSEGNWLGLEEDTVTR